jgi:hypothetical protein
MLEMEIVRICNTSNCHASFMRNAIKEIPTTITMIIISNVIHKNQRKNLEKNILQSSPSLMDEHL